MRTRRWILVIALFIAFTALIIYHGWNLLKVNERIKQYVLIRIKPILGTECQIEKLDMSLGAVHLKNFKVNNNDFLLQIEDVRIGFRFANLVKNSFSSQRIPHDILFVRPHLTLRKNILKGLQKSSPDSSHIEISSNEFWEMIKDIDFIKRITISNGKISYIDSINHSELLLTHDINGWLSSRSEETISARLVGKLFRSKAYNLLMTVDVDLVHKSLDLMEVKVNHYEWKEKIPLIIPDYFDIKHGTIDGIISLAKNKSAENGFEIYGQISINDGAIHIYDERLNFDNINIKTKIQDQSCIIDSAGFFFNGSYVDIAGEIHNFFSPQLDLTLKSDYFDLKKNIENIAPRSRVKVSGYSNIFLHVTNTFKNPAIVGQLSCPAITLNNKKFKQVNTSISLEDSIFKIKEFSGGLDGLELGGQGKIDFSQRQDSIFFSVSGAGKLFPELVPLPFHSLANDTSQLHIQGKGNLAQISGIVDFGIKIATNIDTAFQLNGDFNFAKKKLSLHLNSPSHHFSGVGLVFFSGSRPKYQVRLTDFHNLLYSLPEFKIIKKILNYKTSIVQIQGEQSNWSLTGRYAWDGRMHRTAVMDCRIKSQQHKKQIVASINIYSNREKFNSYIHLIKTPDFWEIINFDIDNLFQCNGRIDLRAEKPIEGSIIFPDASLSDLGNLIFGNVLSINQGKLCGFIGVSGTLKNLKLSANLDVKRMVLNQIGIYDGALTFQFIDQKLVLNQFNIKRNQQSIFKCNGAYSRDTDQLNFDLIGQDIDLNSLITTVLNKPGILQGKGSSRLKLQGSLNRPKLCGQVNVENGKLGPFSFSHVLFDFGEEQYAGTSPDKVRSDSLADEGITLKNILITRIGQFEMQGQGIIPYSSQQPMTIELRGKGNSLSILPELTPFFKDTKSDGEWVVNFTGRPNNLTIAGGKLTLSDGYLRLGDVAPEIKNITAKMELEHDGFLNVKFISGKIRGKPFTFWNLRPDSTLPDTTMQTFAIPEYGLNLGIFAVETSPKGIPLHIPALMAKGEIGQFVFAGKNTREQFYFVGPLEQPKIRGKIQLQNVNFTFPFIKDKSVDTTKTNPVVEVLTHIQWDVTAIAGKDLHYQKEIPSGVDNVYVDLIVDAGVGGLEFNGVISDNSFGVTGNLESSRGYVDYLDLDFQVVKAGVEFDMDVSSNSNVEFDKSSLLPIIYGEARTTVTDSTGYPYYVYLTLLTTDKETGHALKRGRLGEVVFQLSADNPNLGYTEGELLASLGYSSLNFPKMATDLIGISTDNLLFRPLFRPFERQLERTLGLDIVRFSSRFTRNLIEMNLNDERNFLFDSKLFLLRSTKLMVGKYLAERLFLLYTGQLEAGMNYHYQQEGFGFRHTLGLEYRINSSLLLQMEYDYDSLLLWQKEDKKILLRHSFPF